MKCRLTVHSAARTWQQMLTNAVKVDALVAALRRPADQLTYMLHWPSDFPVRLFTFVGRQPSWPPSDCSLQRLWFDVYLYCRRSAPYKWLCTYVCMYDSLMKTIAHVFVLFAHCQWLHPVLFCRFIEFNKTFATADTDILKGWISVKIIDKVEWTMAFS